MAERITVTADDEYSADEFWSALTAEFPAIAAQLRSGQADITADDWAAIQQLPGFQSGMTHAPTALVEVDRG